MDNASAICPTNKSKHYVDFDTINFRENRSFFKHMYT